MEEEQKGRGGERDSGGKNWTRKEISKIQEKGISSELKDENI